MVVFDGSGRVLLREPKNHFGGFTWTFSKGGRDGVEHPVETAQRETLEETGHRPMVVGHIPDAFTGGSTSSVNFFYLAYDPDGHIDLEALVRNGETVSLRRACREDARDLISLSKDTGGRERDLRTLEAAFEHYSNIDSIDD
jgi:8-oxo-dGTP diphosphatase